MLKDFERKWKEPPLGLEYEFGQEYVNLWKNSAFDPEFMKKMVLFLGEWQWLNFPSPVFDWSDDHMTAFNDHLGHLLDLLPELSEFAKNYVIPLGKGISRENREKIAGLATSIIKSRLPKFIPERVIKALIRKVLGTV